MFYPQNAITCTHEQVGAGSFTCESIAKHRTIFAVKMVQSGVASNTEILCGSQTIAKNYAKDLEQTFLSYDCNGTISFSKTGADSSMVSIVYTDYNYISQEASRSAIADTAQITYNGIIIFLVVFFGLLYFFKTKWTRIL